MNASAVIFDLDSTLASTLHRQHMLDAIRAGEATWDDYSLACDHDEPLPAAIRLARLLFTGGQRIIILTGRGDIGRHQTGMWLRRHHVPCDLLLMRPRGDHRSNQEYKADVVADILAGKHGPYTPQLIVDDYPAAAETLEPLGVPVLTVDPRYPAGAPYGAPGTSGA